jgi:hypothetical protein
VVKLLIILALVAIVGSLFYALTGLLRDKGDSNRTVKALTWRIGLSLGLFLLLLFAFWTGLLQPHAL